jgi:DNA-binding GntR family transcriptional regulator
MPRRAAHKSKPTVKVVRAGALTPARAPRAGHQPPRKESLAEQADAQIEEAIVTLQIPPGSTVSELALSEMTGIGQTPIREAIQRLACEHLIVILPQRGLLVPEIDIKKQLKLLRTRREVERLVCRSAAKSATPDERKVFARLAAGFEKAAAANDDVSFGRLDREFNELHELCMTAARNEFAEDAMRLMYGLSRRFWYYHYKQAADLPQMARLHGAVAMAIADGDVDGAGTALDKLLDKIEEFTRATIMEV